MPFKDLQEFFDPTLRLPIGGKVYVVPSPDAKTGLWCQQMLSTATTAAAGVEISESDLESLELDDGEEQELYRRVLGDVFAEMLVDKVPWEMVKHAGLTAFMWIAGNRDAAEAFWSAPLGEARRPSPRSASAKKKPVKKGARKSGRPGSPATSSPSKLAPSQTDSPTSS